MQWPQKGLDACRRHIQQASGLVALEILAMALAEYKCAMAVVLCKSTTAEKTTAGKMEEKKHDEQNLVGSKTFLIE